MASLLFTSLALLLIIMAVVLVTPAISVPLKIGFYQTACPSAETMVRNTATKALAADPAIAAALVRLHFHDCFVRGCDASILLDSKPGMPAEKESTMNKGVQGFEVIDEAKAAIEAQCPNTVSCADIIAFSARDSVFGAGGLRYAVSGGRGRRLGFR
ncbi:PREDICTED: peroxidase [Prunus dulcis]|uniref:peroxidase n=1 Tax=Prunus dulcis TaxID=3755 RepID=A0A5E4EQ99_PRUDU|nr:hypothetical protein L3X38_002410 [Prunus dulcis]VVA16791.1 PREDICTED: peroxidase [Prunus dulcis]